jgi:hypothetical protein
MKSHELTLIRTEGLDTKELEFFIYIGRDCYGVLELNGNNLQKSLLLPAYGRLGIRVCQGKILVGETFVDILSLEQNGLQWLPVLSCDSEPIFELPDEVPCPRVLISIYSSKTKNPGRPVEGLRFQLPAAKEPEEMEKLELLQSFEETSPKSQVEKSSKPIPIITADNPSENPLNPTNSSEPLESKKQVSLIQSKTQEQSKTFEIPKNLQNSPTFPNSIKKSENPLHFSNENIENLEEMLENLSQNLHKSEKKNLQKKRTIRDLQLKLSILHEKCKTLEKSEDLRINQYLTEKILVSEEKTLEMQETIESQKFQISELQAVISNQSALLSDKEDLIIQQECLLNEQDSIIKELESSQSEFELILNEKVKESNQIELSLKETIKSLESRLKESVKSLDLLESTFKETTSKAINLEIALYELQQQGKPLQDKEPCPSCEKFQVEIKGHLENTKRLYQSIEITTEKLNTSEFHNQELIIINQDLTQENQLLKSNNFNQFPEIQSPKDFSLSLLLSNNLPNDEIDDLFQHLFPLTYSRSLKLLPQVYLLSNKKVKITKTSEKLHFFQDNQEISISETESTLKHEKNSLSLEDVSNQLEYKSQNLIHSRATRENKLRVLTKQW